MFVHSLEKERGLVRMTRPLVFFGRLEVLAATVAAGDPFGRNAMTFGAAATATFFGGFPHGVGFVRKFGLLRCALVEHLIDGSCDGVTNEGHLLLLSVHAVVGAPSFGVDLAAATRAEVRARLRVASSLLGGNPASTMATLHMPVQLLDEKACRGHCILLSEGTY